MDWGSLEGVGIAAGGILLTLGASLTGGWVGASRTLTRQGKHEEEDRFIDVVLRFNESLSVWAAAVLYVSAWLHDEGDRIDPNEGIRQRADVYAKDDLNNAANAAVELRWGEDADVRKLAQQARSEVIAGWKKVNQYVPGTTAAQRAATHSAIEADLDAARATRKKLVAATAAAKAKGFP
jgi:hypothetical protein